MLKVIPTCRRGLKWGRSAPCARLAHFTIFGAPLYTLLSSIFCHVIVQCAFSQVGLHNSLLFWRSQRATYRGSCPQSTVLTFQHFRLFGEFTSACPKFYMIWLNRSPNPVGRRGIISSFKMISICLPSRKEKGVGIGTLWSGPDFDALSTPTQSIQSQIRPTYSADNKG